MYLVLQIEGVAYRGRIMVEVGMEIGKHPTTRVEEIKIVDQNKLTVCGFLLVSVVCSL